jgi:hydrogenase nickel incorporation protein HypA/HybF
MHEVSITQNLIEIINENLPDENSKLLKVRLEIGELSGVIPESIEFSYDILIKNTRLENSVIEIERIPVRVQCENCKNEFNVENLMFICPECNSGDVKILKGNELQIKDLIIE